MDSKGRALIETIVVTGIVIAIGLLVSRQVALKYILGIVWSLSLLHQIRRYGLINGLLVIIFSSALVIATQGSLEYLLYLAQFIPLVILISLIIGRDFSLGKGTMCILVACIIINGSLILTTVNKTKADIDTLQNKMQINVQSYMQVFDKQNYYDKMGVSRDQIEAALIVDNKIIQQAVQLLPGILTIYYLLAGLIIYIIAFRFHKGQKAKIPIFSTWHVPWYFIWLAIFGFGFIALGNYVVSHFLIILGCNLTLAIFPFIFILGTSVIIYYLKKWQPTTFTKVVIFFLVLLSPQLVLLLIMLIGIFDPYFDFRRLNSTSENQLGG